MKYTFLAFIAVLTLIFIVLLAAISLNGGFSKQADPSLDQQPLVNENRALRLSEANPINSVYFGDLHIHTAYSSDAYIFGVRSTPDDAYRFAKGETLIHAAGYPIRISKPLDFAAVTDHSEYLGMVQKNPYDLPLDKQSLRDILLNENRINITQKWLRTSLHVARNYFTPKVIDKQASLDAWQDTIDAAERHNLPGRFTTLIGYEWSSQPNGANIHRNVFYKDRNAPEIPWSSLISDDPYVFLQELERQNKNGRKVIAIPHNANLSDGLMYGKNDIHGKAMSEDYARLRMEFEPVSEILQVKGSSDTHPLLSPLDEFADFEIVNANNTAFGEVKPPSGGYVREAFREGLEMQFAKGFNPYQFGVIGSSDGHNSSSPIEESSYHGKLPYMDGSAALRTNQALLTPMSVNRPHTWGSGGLAAVWAKENTREAIFEAIQRKETYATSGTRIKLRFFAAWNFSDQDLNKTDLVSFAYKRGVAMGSTLSLAMQDKNITPSEPSHTFKDPKEKLQPSFLVLAEKDPDAANLDRIQIIKLWVDEKGKSYEKVFNIAASDNRIIDAEGNLKPVGNTVNISEASYSNSIGDKSLAAIWRDPDFKAEQAAAYYVRVLEIPTPRWSVYDAKILGIKPFGKTAIQERAISSPIWYSP